MLYIGFIAEFARLISGIESRGLLLIIVISSFMLKFRTHTYNRSQVNFVILLLLFAPLILNNTDRLFYDSLINYLLLLIFVALLPAQFFEKLRNELFLSKLHFIAVICTAIVAVIQYRLEMRVGHAVILFFSEPAHFVRELAILSALSIASINLKFVYLINILLYIFLGLACPSLLALVVSFGFTFLYFRMYASEKKIIGKLLIYGLAAMIVIFFAMTLLNVEYFSSRLNFNSQLEEFNNLTTLVFLQGYENAYLILKDSVMGTGIGQAADANAGQISKHIYEITNGKNLNLEDAGSLAAKILIEFGWFGVLLNLIIIISSVRLILLDGDTLQTRLLQNISMVFLLFFVLRSAGYFTSINFFVLLLVFHSNRFKNACN